MHEAKSDTDLARLFAACRSGHVAVLIGSTEKMGVGTNVQDRAIALHHLDAPWRPADVDQREGRIIRQGNLNNEVQVIRYITARSFDGYSWQTLERKARFIRDVMSPSLDAREIGDIGDIGDTVLSFSEAKALATNNPLLMDKAEADAELSRLLRAERAHYRNQDTLHRAVAQLETRIQAQAKLANDIDTAIARRRGTRGDAFAMTVQGQRYTKRADAGQHLLGVLRQEAANQLGSRQRTMSTGDLGGFPLTATISQAFGRVQLTLTFDGAPSTDMTLTQQDLAETNPTGLITRLENRLTRLEAAKAEALAEIDHARSEIGHATASIGKPFPQAAELATARDRSRHIDEQLEAAATPPQPPEEEQQASDTDVPASQQHSGPSAGATAATEPERQHASAPDIRNGPEHEGAARNRNLSADAHREPEEHARGNAEGPEHTSTQHTPRPPWPSVAERASGPVPGRNLRPTATHPSLGRPGTVRSQDRDTRQPQYGAQRAWRGDAEPEAGQ